MGLRDEPRMSTSDLLRAGRVKVEEAWDPSDPVSGGVPEGKVCAYSAIARASSRSETRFEREAFNGAVKHIHNAVFGGTDAFGGSVILWNASATKDKVLEVYDRAIVAAEAEEAPGDA